MKIKIFNKSSDFAKKGEVLFPSHKGDAGYDMISVSHPRVVGDLYQGSLFKSIKYIEYDTNLIMEPSSDSYGDYEFFSLMYPRSSISKYNLSLCNSVGVIDSGYRDTIKVRFNYIPQPENYLVFQNKFLLVSIDQSKIYQKGDKVAQLIFAKHVHPKVNIVESLSSSDRGKGGFGSTGK